MLLCAVEVLSFFFFFENHHILAAFLYNFLYGSQEKKNRKKRTQILGYRVEPVTTLVSCVASHPSVAVLGSSDMPPRGWSSCTYPGTGAGPAETGAKFHERCSHLCQPEPSLSACVFWFNTSAMSALISQDCFLCLSS